MAQRWKILELAEQSDSIEELIAALCRSPDVAGCDESSSQSEVLSILEQYRDILPQKIVSQLDQVMENDQDRRA